MSFFLERNLQSFFALAKMNLSEAKLNAIFLRNTSHTYLCIHNRLKLFFLNRFLFEQ